MTPNELYCLTPIRKDFCFEDSLDVLKDIYTTSGQTTFFHSLEEIDHHDIFKIIDQEKLLEMNYYLEQGEDDYIYKLGALFFKNEPLLVFHRSGEDGRYYKAFLTNFSLFEDLKNYVSTKMEQSIKEISVYSKDENIVDLDDVDGYKLSHYYKFSTPLYKKNDLVWAYVPENFNQSQETASFVMTQVKIKNIFPNDLLETYQGIQTERISLNQDIIYSTTAISYNLSVHLNDALILGKVSDIPIPENAVHLHSDENGYFDPYFKRLTLEEIYTIYDNKQKQKNKIKK